MNYYLANGEQFELTDELVRSIILAVNNTDEQIGPDIIYAMAREVLHLRAELRKLKDGVK